MYEEEAAKDNAALSDEFYNNRVTVYRHRCNLDKGWILGYDVWFRRPIAARWIVVKR